ncbi:MAG: hypothetical protein H0X51_05680 [Parachlamydiaceae bacterium]|nr:hypothetical protein [Parachlamydiaceae bacterium]
MTSLGDTGDFVPDTGAGTGLDSAGIGLPTSGRTGAAPATGLGSQHTITTEKNTSTDPITRLVMREVVETRALETKRSTAAATAPLAFSASLDVELLRKQQKRITDALERVKLLPKNTVYRQVAVQELNDAIKQLNVKIHALTEQREGLSTEAFSSEEQVQLNALEAALAIAQADLNQAVDLRETLVGSSTLGLGDKIKMRWNNQTEPEYRLHLNIAEVVRLAKVQQYQLAQFEKNERRLLKGEVVTQIDSDLAHGSIEVLRKAIIQLKRDCYQTEGVDAAKAKRMATTLDDLEKIVLKLERALDPRSPRLQMFKLAAESYKLLEQAKIYGKTDIGHAQTLAMSVVYDIENIKKLGKLATTKTDGEIITRHLTQALEEVDVSTGFKSIFTSRKLTKLTKDQRDLLKKITPDLLLYSRESTGLTHLVDEARKKGELPALTARLNALLDQMMVQYTVKPNKTQSTDELGTIILLRRAMKKEGIKKDGFIDRELFSRHFNTLGEAAATILESDDALKKLKANEENLKVQPENIETRTTLISLGRRLQLHKEKLFELHQEIRFINEPDVRSGLMARLKVQMHNISQAIDTLLPRISQLSYDQRTLLQEITSPLLRGAELDEDGDYTQANVGLRRLVSAAEKNGTRPALETRLNALLQQLMRRYVTQKDKTAFSNDLGMIALLGSAMNTAGIKIDRVFEKEFAQLSNLNPDEAPKAYSKFIESSNDAAERIVRNEEGSFLTETLFRDYMAALKIPPEGPRTPEQVLEVVLEGRKLLATLKARNSQKFAAANRQFQVFMEKELFHGKEKLISNLKKKVDNQTHFAKALPTTVGELRELLNALEMRAMCYSAATPDAISTIQVLKMLRDVVRDTDLLTPSEDNPIEAEFQSHPSLFLATAAGLQKWESLKKQFAEVSSEGFQKELEDLHEEMLSFRTSSLTPALRTLATKEMDDTDPFEAAWGDHLHHVSEEFSNYFEFTEVIVKGELPFQELRAQMAAFTQPTPPVQKSTPPKTLDELEKSNKPLTQENTDRLTVILDKSVVLLTELLKTPQDERIPQLKADIQQISYLLITPVPPVAVSPRLFIPAKDIGILSRLANLVSSKVDLASRPRFNEALDIGDRIMVLVDKAKEAAVNKKTSQACEYAFLARQGLRQLDEWMKQVKDSNATVSADVRKVIYEPLMADFFHLAKHTPLAMTAAETAPDSMLDTMFSIFQLDWDPIEADSALDILVGFSIPLVGHGLMQVHKIIVETPEEDLIKALGKVSTRKEMAAVLQSKTPEFIAGIFDRLELNVLANPGVEESTTRTEEYLSTIFHLRRQLQLYAPTVLEKVNTLRSDTAISSAYTQFFALQEKAAFVIRSCTLLASHESRFPERQAQIAAQESRNLDELIKLDLQVDYRVLKLQQEEPDSKALPKMREVQLAIKALMKTLQDKIRKESSTLIELTTAEKELLDQTWLDRAPVPAALPTGTLSRWATKFKGLFREGANRKTEYVSILKKLGAAAFDRHLNYRDLSQQSTKEAMGGLVALISNLPEDPRLFAQLKADPIAGKIIAKALEECDEAIVQLTLLTGNKEEDARLLPIIREFAPAYKRYYRKVIASNDPDEILRGERFIFSITDRNHPSLAKHLFFKDKSMTRQTEDFLAKAAAIREARGITVVDIPAALQAETKADAAVTKTQDDIKLAAAGAKLDIRELQLAFVQNQTRAALINIQRLKQEIERLKKITQHKPKISATPSDERLSAAYRQTTADLEASHRKDEIIQSRKDQIATIQKTFTEHLSNKGLNSFLEDFSKLPLSGWSPEILLGDAWKEILEQDWQLVRAGLQQDSKRKVAESPAPTAAAAAKTTAPAFAAATPPSFAQFDGEVLRIGALLEGIKTLNQFETTTGSAPTQQTEKANFKQELVAQLKHYPVPLLRAHLDATSNIRDIIEKHLGKNWAELVETTSTATSTVAEPASASATAAAETKEAAAEIPVFTAKQSERKRAAAETTAPATPAATSTVAKPASTSATTAAETKESATESFLETAHEGLSDAELRIKAIIDDYYSGEVNDPDYVFGLIMNFAATTQGREYLQSLYTENREIRNHIGNLVKDLVRAGRQDDALQLKEIFPRLHIPTEAEAAVVEAPLTKAPVSPEKLFKSFMKALQTPQDRTTSEVLEVVLQGRKLLAGLKAKNSSEFPEANKQFQAFMEQHLFSNSQKTLISNLKQKVHNPVHFAKALPGDVIVLRDLLDVLEMRAISHREPTQEAILNLQVLRLLRGVLQSEPSYNIALSTKHPVEAEFEKHPHLLAAAVLDPPRGDALKQRLADLSVKSTEKDILVLRKDIDAFKATTLDIASGVIETERMDKNDPVVVAWSDYVTNAKQEWSQPPLSTALLSAVDLAKQISQRLTPQQFRAQIEVLDKQSPVVAFAGVKNLIERIDFQPHLAAELLKPLRGNLTYGDALKHLLQGNQNIKELKLPILGLVQRLQIHMLRGAISAKAAPEVIHKHAIAAEMGMTKIRSELEKLPAADKKEFHEEVQNLVKDQEDLRFQLDSVTKQGKVWTITTNDLKLWDKFTNKKSFSYEDANKLGRLIDKKRMIALTDSDPNKRLAQFRDLQILAKLKPSDRSNIEARCNTQLYYDALSLSETMAPALEVFDWMQHVETLQRGTEIGGWTETYRSTLGRLKTEWETHAKVWSKATEGNFSNDMLKQLIRLQTFLGTAVDEQIYAVDARAASERQTSRVLGLQEAAETETQEEREYRLFTQEPKEAAEDLRRYMIEKRIDQERVRTANFIKAVTLPTSHKPGVFTPVLVRQVMEARQLLLAFRHEALQKASTGAEERYTRSLRTFNSLQRELFSNKQKTFFAEFEKVGTLHPKKAAAYFEKLMGDKARVEALEMYLLTRILPKGAVPMLNAFKQFEDYCNNTTRYKQFNELMAGSAIHTEFQKHHEIRLAAQVVHYAPLFQEKATFQEGTSPEMLVLRRQTAVDAFQKAKDDISKTVDPTTLLDPSWNDWIETETGKWADSLQFQSSLDELNERRTQQVQTVGDVAGRISELTGSIHQDRTQSEVFEGLNALFDKVKADPAKVKLFSSEDLQEFLSKEPVATSLDAYAFQAKIAALQFEQSPKAQQPAKLKAAILAIHNLETAISSEPTDQASQEAETKADHFTASSPARSDRASADVQTQLKAVREDVYTHAVSKTDLFDLTTSQAKLLMELFKDPEKQLKLQIVHKELPLLLDKIRMMAFGNQRRDFRVSYIADLLALGEVIGNMNAIGDKDLAAAFDLMLERNPTLRTDAAISNWNSKMKTLEAAKFDDDAKIEQLYKEFEANRGPWEYRAEEAERRAESSNMFVQLELHKTKIQDAYRQVKEQQRVVEENQPAAREPLAPLAGSRVTPGPITTERRRRTEKPASLTTRTVQPGGPGLGVGLGLDPGYSSAGSAAAAPAAKGKLNSAAERSDAFKQLMQKFPSRISENLQVNKGLITELKLAVKEMKLANDPGYKKARAEYEQFMDKHIFGEYQGRLVKDLKSKVGTKDFGEALPPSTEARENLKDALKLRLFAYMDKSPDKKILVSVFDEATRIDRVEAQPKARSASAAAPAGAGVTRPRVDTPDLSQFAAKELSPAQIEDFRENANNLVSSIFPIAPGSKYKVTGEKTQENGQLIYTITNVTTKKTMRLLVAIDDSGVYHLHLGTQVTLTSGKKIGRMTLDYPFRLSEVVFDISKDQISYSGHDLSAKPEELVVIAEDSFDDMQALLQKLV